MNHKKIWYKTCYLLLLSMAYFKIINSMGVVQHQPVSLLEKIFAKNAELPKEIGLKIFFMCDEETQYSIGLLNNQFYKLYKTLKDHQLTFLKNRCNAFLQQSKDDSLQQNKSDDVLSGLCAQYTKESIDNFVHFFKEIHGYKYRTVQDYQGIEYIFKLNLEYQVLKKILFESARYNCLPVIYICLEKGCFDTKQKEKNQYIVNGMDVMNHELSFNFLRKVCVNVCFEKMHNDLISNTQTWDTYLNDFCNAISGINIDNAEKIITEKILCNDNLEKKFLEIIVKHNFLFAMRMYLKLNKNNKRKLDVFMKNQYELFVSAIDLGYYDMVKILADILLIL